MFVLEFSFSSLNINTWWDPLPLFKGESGLQKLVKRWGDLTFSIKIGLDWLKEGDSVKK